MNDHIARIRRIQEILPDIATKHATNIFNNYLDLNPELDEDLEDILAGLYNVDDLNMGEFDELKQCMEKAVWTQIINRLAEKILNTPHVKIA